MLELTAILVTAYLIGGIPFGYLIARARGVDILAVGSGNIGATNVGRVLGYRWGLLVFALDFAKGAGPVLAARLVQRIHPIHVGGEPWESWLEQGLAEVGAGLLAFLGHVLPVYIGFRGGKGVATGAGVVAVLVPVPALAAFVAWALFASTTRFISLASMVAALVLAVFQLAMTSFDPNNPCNWFCVLAAALVLVRHRGNWMRLLKGTENRLPPSPKLDGLARALHVVAVALWFGSGLFFTAVVAPLVFSTLENLTQSPRDDHKWLPLPGEYDRVDEQQRVNGPQEQGRRLAGRVVGAIFPRYFLLQILCALVALVPAFAWRQGSAIERVHGLRCWLLLAGLLLALTGAWLQHVVHGLQGPRNEAVEEYLKNRAAGSSTDALAREMQEARGRFGMWHGISILVNLATIAMAAGAMLLTAWLPDQTRTLVNESLAGAAGSEPSSNEPAAAQRTDIR